MPQKCCANCCRHRHRRPTIVELSLPCEPLHHLLMPRLSLLPSRPWWSPLLQQPTSWQATCWHHHAGGGWWKRGRAAEAAAAVGGLWFDLPFFLPPTASNPIPAIFCFGDRIYEFLQRKRKAQRRRKNTILRRLWVERKDGARLFVQIKACTILKAQSFALRSL